jgi:hypothetical protein
VSLRPSAGQGLLILQVSRSHTATFRRRYDSSGRVISSSQRPVPDITQHSQYTNIHALCGIRIHNVSRQADRRPRPYTARSLGQALISLIYLYKIVILLILYRLVCVWNLISHLTGQQECRCTCSLWRCIGLCQDFLREKVMRFHGTRVIKKIVGFSPPMLTKVTISEQHDLQISYDKLNPNLTKA